MSADDPRLRPAPHGDRLSARRAFFLLFGGPIAWFVQLCASVALLGWPCFPMTDRYAMPLPDYGWTRTAAVALLALSVLAALAAGFASVAKLGEVKDEESGGHTELIEIGHGRTRFTAMWGAILGFGFSLATLLTAVPFLLVSRCAG